MKLFKYTKLSFHLFKYLFKENNIIYSEIIFLFRVKIGKNKIRETKYHTK